MDKIINKTLAKQTEAVAQLMLHLPFAIYPQDSDQSLEVDGLGEGKDMIDTR